mmetsp:Transcript_91615/g.163057  ORF Transcript_91615/g.163057 Transcript_91615/m.163057 type:complete len:614 (-) Transcript_91615:36-1877(-)|eukprot:CAMPEP_0197633508 /NCGR_PEP_ID=MMETSP1338-20131121/9857_1 /TAXON_ID=43686 ORGANISM="Pelagodinium beii, Strain RCC1491" /NCGR_SAMPLE_ID=MMETSP1338 /ASSEMBLY_ACC=CAM_ASM_000754 /LENGTH=613 /DNA_ID=CAMNT_0043205183 /DNA_START=49 /DNA_END=1890 /DNA_ORIENTATION=-
MRLFSLLLLLAPEITITTGQYVEGIFPPETTSGEFVTSTSISESFAHEEENDKAWQEEEHEEPEISREGGGEGGEHNALDEVTWTATLLLVGFLVLGMGLLYLVNLRDKDVRKSMWGMINATTSIFLAATFDVAVFKFLDVQIVKSPWPRGLGLRDTPWVSSITGLSFMVCTSIILHVIVFKLDAKNELWVFCVNTLGSHIYAFSGILTFGYLQMSTWFRQSVWRMLLVPVVAGVVMTSAYKLVIKVFKSQAKSAMSLTPKEKTNLKKKCHVASEIQVDAAAIIIGFLTVQCICYSLSEGATPFLKIPPILHGNPPKHVASGEIILLLSAVGFFMVMGCASALGGKSKMKKLPCDLMLEYEFLLVFLSCTGCWCLQQAGNWLLYDYLDGGKDEHDSDSVKAIMGNAFLMTALAVVAIVIVDKLADHADIQVERVRKESLSAETVEGFVERAPSRELNKNMAQPRLDLEVDFDLDNDFDFDLTPRFPIEFEEEHFSAITTFLRAIIDGLAMVVGISWDKAFETAHESIASGIPFMEKHQVIGTGLTAVGLIAFVLPAWFWYIAPKAWKKVEEHAEDIENEKKRDRKYDDTQLDSDGPNHEETDEQSDEESERCA